MYIFAKKMNSITNKYRHSLCSCIAGTQHSRGAHERPLTDIQMWNVQDKSKVGAHMAMDIHASMQSIEIEQEVLQSTGICFKASCDSTCTPVKRHLISL